MKIIALSSQHSDKISIALVTEPPLTPAVFEEFASRLCPPNLSARLVSGCLAVQPDRYSPELRAELERSLTRAEDIVNGVAARKQAEAEQEQSEKELTLESAAAGFELPVV